MTKKKEHWTKIIQKIDKTPSFEKLKAYIIQKKIITEDKWNIYYPDIIAALKQVNDIYDIKSLQTIVTKTVTDFAVKHPFIATSLAATGMRKKDQFEDQTIQNDIIKYILAAVAQTLEPEKSKDVEDYPKCNESDPEFTTQKGAYLNALKASPEYKCAKQVLDDNDKDRFDKLIEDTYFKNENGKCQSFNDAIRNTMTNMFTDADNRIISQYDACKNGKEAPSLDAENPPEQTTQSGDADNPPEQTTQSGDADKPPEQTTQSGDADKPLEQPTQSDIVVKPPEENPNKRKNPDEATGGAPERRKVFILHRWRIVHQFGRCLYVNVKGRLVRLSQLKRAFSVQHM